MEQLSLLDFSTDVADYLNRSDVTISKKLSRSINSKGHNILMYKGHPLCFVHLYKVEEIIGLEVNAPDDWTGIYIPCTIYEVAEKLNCLIDKYIDKGVE